MKKQIVCKICGSNYHYQTFCPYKPKKPIAKKRDMTWENTKEKWKLLNPPNSKGLWICYLQISPMCFLTVTYQTLTLDHVIPRVRGKKYKYDLNNLQPCCAPCNGLKGSRTLESLAKDYPHLNKYLVDTKY